MKRLEVKLRLAPDDIRPVGTLAEQDRRIYFEYERAFVDGGLELSPYKLPLGPGLTAHEDLRFGPLPGLFDDSLPDGWGLVLMDRHFRAAGVELATLSPLDRLSYLGSRTMGALTYQPAHELEPDRQLLDLGVLGQNAAAVLAGDAAEVLPALMQAGGSPGGARPKVLVGLDGDRVVTGEEELPEPFEPWIVKFAARGELAHAGPVEHAYSLMAREAGIALPPTRLIEVRRGGEVDRFFAIRRFDRGPGNRRFHMHTLANLLHLNFRIPSADYLDLFRATRALTRDQGDALQMFRRMVFNVAAHNRDDHTKNFAFVLDDRSGEWSLSPAYDLTFAAGPGGEHSTTIQGEGRHPTRTHCLEVAAKAGLRRREAEAAIEQVNNAVARWSHHAERSSCPRATVEEIAGALVRL